MHAVVNIDTLDSSIDRGSDMAAAVQHHKRRRREEWVKTCILQRHRLSVATRQPPAQHSSNFISQFTSSKIKNTIYKISR